MLIAVLWICAVISWIALSFAAKGRFEAEAKRLHIEKTKGLYLALSGVHETLARMVNDSGRITLDENRLKPDGQPRRIDFSMGRCLVIVENELDKININLVSRETLEDVLSRSGYSEDAARMAFEIEASIHPQDGDGLACSPCGELETIEQMVLYPGVSAEAFYGHMYRPWANADDVKKSLFSLFTVAGDRAEPIAEGDATDQEFEDGGTYRIVSVGKVSEDSAASAVWLVIKLSSSSMYGYEILYRKVL